MTLLVEPSTIATRLRLVTPMSTEVSNRVTEAITDSQDKVATYLNRASLEPTVRTIKALYPDDSYPLDDWHAWPQVRDTFDDRYRVASYVANTANPNTYDVTFNVGLDTANDPELSPILTFIKQDVCDSLIADPIFVEAARKPISVSAEGQSISYDRYAYRESAANAGSTMQITALKRWKRLSIRQPPAHRIMPFPYNYMDRWSW